MNDKILWRLLGKHVSKMQLAGFAAANLIGLAIVLVGLQFFLDVRPVFADEDSFARKDYLVVTKKIGGFSALQSFAGNANANAFSEREIKDLESQNWVRTVGKFSTSGYPVYGTINLAGKSMSLRTGFFFESVPDEFIDVESNEWMFDPHHPSIPIIISKDYLSLYNFGFAASQGMPQISEGMAGMVPVVFYISGTDGRTEAIPGKIVGFSNRLNTIVVPESFMTWSNDRFAGGKHNRTSRLIVEVNSPGNAAIDEYMDKHGYEVAGDKMNSSKANHLLTVVTGIVIAVGLVISMLSFFILMLSIYLLLQKNTRKLQDLLMLGYSPCEVAGLYERMVLAVNAFIFIIAFAGMLAVRCSYLPYLRTFALEGTTVAWSALAGIAIFGLITAGNIAAIRRKIASLWLEGK